MYESKRASRVGIVDVRGPVCGVAAANDHIAATEQDREMVRSGNLHVRKEAATGGTTAIRERAVDQGAPLRKHLAGGVPAANQHSVRATVVADRSVSGAGSTRRIRRAT